MAILSEPRISALKIKTPIKVVNVTGMSQTSLLRNGGQKTIKARILIRKEPAAALDPEANIAEQKSILRVKIKYLIIGFALAKMQ